MVKLGRYFVKEPKSDNVQVASYRRDMSDRSKGRNCSGQLLNINIEKFVTREILNEIEWNQNPDLEEPVGYISYEGI